VTIRDGRDGIFESGSAIINIVIIDMTVTFRRLSSRLHPIGRDALLIRSVKSAFALLLEKVIKPRLAPDNPQLGGKLHETND